MRLIVTWDHHETRQAETEVGEDLGAVQLGCMAQDIAREGQGEVVSTAAPDVVDWTLEDEI